MREKAKTLQAMHPFSSGLLVLGGEIALLLAAAALFLFLFANRLPQPAAAYALADDLAGGVLRVCLLSVMVALANDLAARLLARRRDK